LNLRAAIFVRIELPEICSYRIQIRFSLGHRPARLQTAVESKKGLATISVPVGAAAKLLGHHRRDPKRMSEVIDCARKRIRHHSDDRVLMPIDVNRLPRQIAVRVEVLLPHALTDDGNGMSVRG